MSFFIRIFIFLILILPHVLLRAENINPVQFCSQHQSYPTRLELEEFFLFRQIQLQGEKPDEDILLSLSYLFQEFGVKGPLKIFFLKEIGPQKIFKDRKREDILYVTSNAKDLLLVSALREKAREICSTRMKRPKEFHLEYTHTVYEQFLRHVVSSKLVLKKMEDMTGLRFRSKNSEEGYLEEQELRDEEVITLFKSFMDIPNHVFNKMKLKKVVRVRIGLDLNNASADYTENLKRIRLTDKAMLSDSQIYGEGTIVHELGHAYQAGQTQNEREEFIKISWRKENGQWVRKENSGKGMISLYAMKNEKEDFAEHFGAFIHEPEKLKNLSPEKFAYFKKKVFIDTEYFSTAAKNAKIFIDSKISDSEKPYLVKELSESLFLSVEKHSFQQTVKAKVTGVYDDLSGVGPTSLHFRHRKNKTSRFIVNLKPVIKNDQTTLEGYTDIDLKKLSPGIYDIKSFILEDLAGNSEYFKGNPIASLNLSGEQGTQLRNTKINIEKIKILKKDEPSHPTFIMTLPIEHTDDLERIYLSWNLKHLQERTSHSITHYLSVPGDKNIKFEISFNGDYPQGDVSLSRIQVDFHGGAVFQEESISENIPEQQKTTLHLKTGKTQMDLIRPLVNKMKLKAVVEDNKYGGIHNILMTLPVQVVNSDKASLMIRIRDPKGKVIYRSYREPNEQLEANGPKDQRVIELIMPLRKYPEKGEYIVESIVTTSRKSDSYSTGLNLDSGTAFKVRDKLLERGIRKSFQVTQENQLKVY
ncbi:hypothetical protein [Bacteriovorax sp. DB6_IX]|uniref:putative zinc-binding metallopeptidase n=1 Tax=Bacteriovorax sp. DB6_IX TaxID=1353530 RepID=UPI00038A49D9|nr:hypothetical protein [Bacteriovorax sp. DB6_IX]EQC50737.1 hypothetical protein M901_0893 [Bacteriovorax sp. DB6_IX]